MRNNICSVITSAAMLLTCCVVSSSVVAADDAAFTLDYFIEDNNVKATLSVDDNAKFLNFDCEFRYDAKKYSLIEANADNPNVLINSIPEKGKIFISFSDIRLLTDPTDFFTLSFKCTENADVSDFNIEVKNVYDVNLDEISSKVDTRLDGKIVGKEESTVNPTSATVMTTDSVNSSATTVMTTDSVKPSVTTVTTIGTVNPSTTVPLSENNIFYYYNEFNKETGCVELVFGVKGKVQFDCIDGFLKLESKGLGEPKPLNSAPGMVINYVKEKDTIKFVFSSPDGKGISNEMTLFKYSFDVLDKNYKLSVEPGIGVVADVYGDDIDYCIINDQNEQTPSDSGIVTTTPTKPVELKGDINNDGVISAADLVLMIRYILTSNDADIIKNKSVYDMNSDGKINVFDLARLKKYIL